MVLGYLGLYDNEADINDVLSDVMNKYDLHNMNVTADQKQDYPICVPEFPSTILYALIPPIIGQRKIRGDLKNAFKKLIKMV